MFSLSRLATSKLCLRKSGILQAMSLNFSQLTKQNVFFFATKTINLPFLADSINEGTITEFVKKEGDWV